MGKRQESVQSMDNAQTKTLEPTAGRSTAHMRSLRAIPLKRPTENIDRQIENDLEPRKNDKEKHGSLLSLVIPVFNEEENLEELINRCLETCIKMKRPFEIVLIDDGSSDNSSRMIEEAADNSGGTVIGILLNRNYGQHSAIMAGFAESKGDIVVTLDADLQNPPEEIPKLVDAINAGSDVVGSVRIQRQDSLFRKIPSFIVNRIAQKVTGVKMNDYGCMLRAYRRNIIDAVLQCHERSTFIPVLANSFARKAVEVHVQHRSRLKGESKYSLWKLVSLQFDLLTSMTTLPLRLMTMIGVVISFFGVGFGMFLIAMRLIYGSGWAAEGVFTLFAFMFIFIGAQFIAIGLLGEYIGRIYYDVRGRPRYFVEQVIGRKRSNTQS